MSCLVIKDTTKDDELCTIAHTSTNVDALTLVQEELVLRAKRRVRDAAARTDHIGWHTWLRGSLATTLDLLTAADVARMRIRNLTNRSTP